MKRRTFIALWMVMANWWSMWAGVALSRGQVAYAVFEMSAALLSVALIYNEVFEET